MYVSIFIDWENLEKTVKQEFGCILNYEEFNKIIRNIALKKDSKLVGVYAYGDFDKGLAGIMSKLINLGIEPKHVVTKTAQNYLKGSTDIELSLDVLDTMYAFPLIDEFLFISGDSDLRHVMKRLTKNGKHLRLAGFKNNTSQFIIEMVDEFIPLDDYKNIMRKVTQPEKEQLSLSLIGNRYIKLVIEEMLSLENKDLDFIGLNYLRKRLTDYYLDEVTEISDAITVCLDYELITIYQVNNSKDPSHPTTACSLNKKNKAVEYLISTH